MPSRGKAQRLRGKHREWEFIDARGACEHCSAPQFLMVFWRDLRVRHTAQMQTFWYWSDQRRLAVAGDLIVLCHICMRMHKSGIAHGEGAVGIRGCKCDLCVERHRRYNADRMREWRQRKREGKK